LPQEEKNQLDFSKAVEKIAVGTPAS